MSELHAKMGTIQYSLFRLILAVPPPTHTQKSKYGHGGRICNKTHQKHTQDIKQVVSLQSLIAQYVTSLWTSLMMTKPKDMLKDEMVNLQFESTVRTAMLTFLQHHTEASLQ
jgi:hypothetical protein